MSCRTLEGEPCCACGAACCPPPMSSTNRTYRCPSLVMRRLSTVTTRCALHDRVGVRLRQSLLAVVTRRARRATLYGLTRFACVCSSQTLQERLHKMRLLPAPVVMHAVADPVGLMPSGPRAHRLRECSKVSSLRAQCQHALMRARNTSVAPVPPATTNESKSHLIGSCWLCFPFALPGWTV